MSNLIETDMLEWLRFPGNFFRYGSIRTRGFYAYLSRLLRKRTMEEFSRFDLLCDSQVKITDSFWRGKSTDFNVKPVLKSCNAKIDKLIKYGPTEYQSKDYLQKAELGQLDISNPVFQLASDPQLIAPVAQYLGMLPVVNEVQIWHSPNTSTLVGGSQELHLDYADCRQVKLFMLLNDVDSDTGPLGFLGSGSSSKLAEQLKYKFTNSRIRVSDDEFQRYFNWDDINLFCGTAGDMALIDTSNCFHFGSRKAGKPRRLLMIQYITPFAFSLPFDFSSALKFRNITGELSELQSLIFRGSCSSP